MVKVLLVHLIVLLKQEDKWLLGKCTIIHVYNNNNNNNVHTLLGR